jgi:C4-type Zn-finger protein
MEWCPDCGHRPIDRIEYLEEPLPGFGDVIRIILLLCDRCGWYERHTSQAVPVPA